MLDVHISWRSRLAVFQTILPDRRENKEKGESARSCRITPYLDACVIRGSTQAFRRKKVLWRAVLDKAPPCFVDPPLNLRDHLCVAMYVCIKCRDQPREMPPYPID